MKVRNNNNKNATRRQGGGMKACIFSDTKRDGGQSQLRMVNIYHSERKYKERLNVNKRPNSPYISAYSVRVYARYAQHEL